MALKLKNSKLAINGKDITRYIKNGEIEFEGMGDLGTEITVGGNGADLQVFTSNKIDETSIPKFMATFIEDGDLTITKLIKDIQSKKQDNTATITTITGKTITYLNVCYLGDPMKFDANGETKLTFAGSIKY